MRKRLAAILILIGMILSGCVAVFQNFDRTPPKVLDVPVSVFVHVVTHRSQIPLDRRNIVGAWRNGEIWVLATEQKGEFHVDPYVLGHEVLHEMHAGDSRFPNPDKLTVWFQ